MNGPLENMQAANHATSQPIPSAWIERIWDRLKTMYGSKFIDLWRDVDPIQLKQAWAEELSGYTAYEIKRGLEACKARPFPPTLPELLTLCRPAITAESAFYEAVEQIRRRTDGRDKWSHPAVYFAAARIGVHDLTNNAWAQIKGRWTAVFGEVMGLGIWPEIPPPREALPAPGQQSISREDADKRMGEIREKTGFKQPKEIGGKNWAKIILERVGRGEDVGFTAERFAREALQGSAT